MRIGACVRPDSNRMRWGRMLACAKRTSGFNGLDANWKFDAPRVTGGSRLRSVVSDPATPQFQPLHEQIRSERRVQRSDQVHNQGPDQLRINFCDRVVAYRGTATGVRGISLKMDPPGLTIRPGPEVRVAPMTVTKSRVSANGNINLRMVCVSWNSRRHTPLVERLRHLLKRRRNHTDQASRGGLTEIFLGRGPGGCVIARLRHASLVVGKDGVKFLLDVFGHTDTLSQRTPRSLRSGPHVMNIAPVRRGALARTAAELVQRELIRFGNLAR